MSLKALLAACVIAAFFCCRAAFSADAARPPNIVFILIDDMGWKDVACNGSRFYETPNIDALAARGMRFTNAYAACPVCSPSRAAILTGKYPARLHLTDYLPGEPNMPSHKLLRPNIIDHLPLEENNLARALKAAGYHSASIGKWHLGAQQYWPEHQGFDLNVAGTESGSPPGGYYYFRNARIAAHDPQEYLTDRLTDEAEKFIDANKDNPFFLYLAHYAVHIPLEAKQKLIGHFADKIRLDDPQQDAIYAAIVQSVDESVGRIVRKVNDLGLADHTLIVFTSDNGSLSVRQGVNTPATSNAPLREGKGYLYEGGVREPCIICWTGVISPASVSDEPICGIDFYPTFLEAAGVQPQPGQVIDGVSLMPVLQQSGHLTRESLFWHYPHYSDQGGKPGSAMRQGDWKLIRFDEDKHVELYNLAADIGEKTDLAQKEPARAAQMEKQLDGWLKSVNAQLTAPNPDFGRPATRRQRQQQQEAVRARRAAD